MLNDGVIINNLVDMGEFSRHDSYESKVIIIFNPSQVKSVYNTNPTNNADIRYSLDVPTTYSIFGEDLTDEELDNLFVGEERDTQTRDTKDTFTSIIKAANKTLQFNYTNKQVEDNSNIKSYVNNPDKIPIEYKCKLSNKIRELSKIVYFV